MLRFQNKDIAYDDKAAISDAPLVLNGNVWKNCRNNLEDMIDLIPVRDADGEVIAYGYQDNEANRELRMLKELRKCKDVLQFTDIFPEYKEIVIYGCNELAVSFATYLEELDVVLSVTGKYWDYFGYRNCNDIDLLEEKPGKLVIYAEGMPEGRAKDITHKMKRSVSPEFECIDEVYEKNVLKGKVTDTACTFEELIHQLKKAQEIVILGNDRAAQDTYDLLMKYGIDICNFAIMEEKNEILLGKPVLHVAEAIKKLRNPVFLNCKDTHSALGEEWTEYFDYRGYERNSRFFLIRDYTDIPDSNLIHVLRGKNILLTGDERLCQLLSDYLYRVENNEVTVRYIPLAQKVSINNNEILCLVMPDYHNRVHVIRDRRKDVLRRQLSDMGFTNYTNYFTCNRAFVLIDKYLNLCMEKYTLSELIPKGITLGRIPAWSGNVFFRGIMDGHPEILMIPYSDLNENLFYYCIRLAGVEAKNILPTFWKMYNEEACSKEKYFPYPEKFEARVERLLSLKERFTSQELFVLFHIAYAETLSDKQITDISSLVIYWEPHFVSRNEFPFYALWLEDKRINGQTIVLRRNNIMRTGSCCARILEKQYGRNVFNVMFLDESVCDGVHLQLSCWKEWKLRFEDIKVNPREKLTEICEHLEIAWSDNMMQTTSAGKMLEYRGSVDFDLKAVFNKYDEYLSEFDRFRISIASSYYQKRYGYSYENCMKFSRKELQELFLKPFLFEEKIESERRTARRCEWVNWQLWNDRKHVILDDVNVEFDMFELGQTGTKRLAEINQKSIEQSIEFIKTHEKLIIYGTGNDCTGLLNLLDEDVKSRILYSDRKAEKEHYTFLGKNVIEPNELCDRYVDYNILVSSSLYGKSIENEFNKMGIQPLRVFYNEAKFENINAC